MRSREGTLRGHGVIKNVNCAFRPLFKDLQVDRDAKQPLAKKLEIPHMGGSYAPPLMRTVTQLLKYSMYITSNATVAILLMLMTLLGWPPSDGWALGKNVASPVTHPGQRAFS